MLNVFLYGSRDEGDRIKVVFDPSEIEIVYLKQKITRPRDLRLLRNLRGIDLAIVDAVETGAKQVCNYLAGVRRVDVALLVNGDYEQWSEWTHYPVLAYIPKAAGDKELAARVRSLISRTRSSRDTVERINSN
jgi:hypothetical protein